MLDPVGRESQDGVLHGEHPRNVQPAKYRALSGAWTLGLGIDSLVIGTNGAGQRLGAAPVALALAGYYGLRLVGDVRQVPARSA